MLIIISLSDVQVPHQALEYCNLVLGTSILNPTHTGVPGTWVYISKDSGAGGGGKLRINLRKVKDVVNDTSILAIFSLKFSNLQNFL